MNETNNILKQYAENNIESEKTKQEIGKKIKEKVFERECETHINTLKSKARIKAGMIVKTRIDELKKRLKAEEEKMEKLSKENVEYKVNLTEKQEGYNLSVVYTPSTTNTIKIEVDNEIFTFDIKELYDFR